MSRVRHEAYRVVLYVPEFFLYLELVALNTYYHAARLLVACGHIWQESVGAKAARQNDRQHRAREARANA